METMGGRAEGESGVKEHAGPGAGAGGGSGEVSCRGQGGIWVRARPSPQAPGPTFEIEVSGTIGVLRDRPGVNLERVHVARVPGHHHVVPLVVIDWFVRVPLHQGRAIPQVKHIVDVPAPR